LADAAQILPIGAGHHHLQVYAIQSGVFIVVFLAVGLFTVFLIFSSHNQRIIEYLWNTNESYLKCIKMCTKCYV